MIFFCVLIKFLFFLNNQLFCFSYIRHRHHVHMHAQAHAITPHVCTCAVPALMQSRTHRQSHTQSHVRAHAHKTRAFTHAHTTHAFAHTSTTHAFTRAHMRTRTQTHTDTPTLFGPSWLHLLDLNQGDPASLSYTSATNVVLQYAAARPQGKVRLIGVCPTVQPQLSHPCNIPQTFPPFDSPSAGSLVCYRWSAHLSPKAVRSVATSPPGARGCCRTGWTACCCCARASTSRPAPCFGVEEGVFPRWKSLV